MQTRPFVHTAAILLAAALAACGPQINTPAPQNPGRDNPPATADRPAKPPAPPTPLPPNVTRVVNPDGTVSITIREPRCPTCQPWTY